uniref:Uncharacterized protein n=1 Tax=Arundo donax TaxID=35708 RepID=A0A0A8ZSS5_ARUDO
MRGMAQCRCSPVRGESTAIPAVRATSTRQPSNRAFPLLAAVRQLARE